MPTPAEPPVSPSSPSTPGADDALAWLVSYGEQDDRELRPNEIAESLRRGEITAATIVWRDGLPEWKAIADVPELARLLPSSGETAGLPQTAPGKAKPAEPAPPRPGAPRAAASPPRTGAAATATTAAAKASAGAKAANAPSADAKAPGADAKAPGADAKAPGTNASPTDATKAPGWKGTTRIGLPKPGAGATAQPGTQVATAKTEPKKFEFKKVTPKVAEPTPTVPLGGPNAPAPFAAAAAIKPETATPSPQPGAASLWSNDDDEPISIDPESLRPPSPSPPLTRATALSAGTLASGPTAPSSPRKSAPKPPTPKRPAPPAAAERRADDAPESATPGLHALSAPLTAATSDRADDIMSLGGAPSGAMLAAPTIDFMSDLTSGPVQTAAAGTFGLPLLHVPDGESEALPDTTPTVPLSDDSGGRKRAASAASAASLDSTGATGVEKKRSVAPFVLGGALLAVAITLVLRGTGHHEPAPIEAAAPRAEATVAAPAPVPPPEAPAAVAPAATETTTVVATAAPPPTGTAADAPRTPEQAAGGSAAPALPAKAEPVTAAPKAEAPKAEAPKAEAPKAEAPKAEAPKAEAPKAAADDSVAEGGEFDKAAAAAALAAAAEEAAGCRKEGDPSGIATVHVTFSNAGRATRATLEGPPFGGTPTGGCITAALRRAKVPAYGGDRVTVTKRVVIH